MERIGTFRVVREIGRGGMGVVYLAQDERLDRDVAIKALPGELSSDAARLERFAREAKTLAQLNHPNIAGIYGVEEQDGQKYLILEYVEGETLGDRLDRGPIPVDEALEIAVEIAAGVEAAHDAGVIHRDLKPDNIKLTPEGKVKVLDFGLAKVEEGVSSSMFEAPTVTRPRSPTIPGAILGTAAYMSPEQARGRRVDKRTDIWSFGVILYEMLTGASPFVGETASDSIGAVLHKSFDFDSLPRQTPGRVRRVLRRCLERDRALRCRDIGEARLWLVLPDDEAGATGSRGSGLAWGAVAAGLVVAAGGVAFGLLRSSGASPAEIPLVRFSFACPVPPDPGSTLNPSVQVAPDGSAVAVQTDNGGAPIFLRRLGQTDLRELALPWEADLVGWTPDSRWLIVLRGDSGSGELWRISPSGENPRLICPLPRTGFLWADSVKPIDDDTLVMGMAPSGLYTVALRGGEPSQLLDAGEEELLVQPTPIPGTDAIVFFEITSGRIEMLRRGKRSVLLDLQGDRLSQLDYAPSGHLLFSVYSGRRGAATWSVPFDPVRLRITGDPVRMLPNASVGVSSDGTLAYAPRVELPSEFRQIVWVTREGTVDRAVGGPLPDAHSPSLSGDGRRIAVSATSSDSLGASDRVANIFVMDAQSGSRSELTDGLGSDILPFWRQDNETIVFTTYNAGIRRAREAPASGSAPPVTVDPRALIAMPSDDGRYLITSISSLGYIETGSTEEQVFAPDSTYNFDLSSDSAYLAFTRGRAGDGLLLQRFPQGGALTTVTTMDVSGVRWNADNTELFFWSEEDLYAVSIDLTGPQPIVGTPEKLFGAAEVGVLPGRNYDVAADGRFLMVQVPASRVGAPESLDVFVVQNWASEFAEAP